MSKSHLPNDMMNAEDDQILAELSEALDIATATGPYQDVCDMLDPTDADPNELMGIDEDERKLIMLYAKLGRNHWMRYLDQKNQEEADDE
jgi:hypothetical protein